MDDGEGMEEEAEIKIARNQCVKMKTASFWEQHKQIQQFEHSKNIYAHPKNDKIQPENLCAMVVTAIFIDNFRILFRYVNVKYSLDKFSNKKDFWNVPTWLRFTMMTKINSFWNKMNNFFVHFSYFCILTRPILQIIYW